MARTVNGPSHPRGAPRQGLKPRNPVARAVRAIPPKVKPSAKLYSRKMK